MTRMRDDKQHFAEQVGTVTGVIQATASERDDEHWNPWGDSYEPSAPLAARGGIRAQAERAELGASWQSRRWLETIERLGSGTRMEEGARYARSGQVIDLELVRGMVTAQVQGSRRAPYRIVIALQPLTGEQVERVGLELQRRPLVASQILWGTLHEDLERAFDAANAPLFPTELGQIATKCSCPDWSNPCKHVAAVCFLVAEELERDGTVLLRLRGIEREWLAKRLGTIDEPRATPSGDMTTASSSGNVVTQVSFASGSQATGAPLPTNPDDFWRTPGPLDHIVGDTERAVADAAVVRRLGSFPLWRGESPFLDTMERCYAQASTAALDLLANRAISL